MSSVADNAIFKTGRKTSRIASGVWHVAPSCWKQMFPISSSLVLVSKNSFNMITITIAIDCNGLSLLIFEEKCRNYASGPKSAPTSDSFRLNRFFNVIRLKSLTYLIGHLQPLNVNLVAHITHVVRVNFIHEWRKDGFLMTDFFLWQLNLLSGFLLEIS